MRDRPRRPEPRIRPRPGRHVDRRIRTATSSRSPRPSSSRGSPSGSAWASPSRSPTGRCSTCSSTSTTAWSSSRSSTSTPARSTSGSACSGRTCPACPARSPSSSRWPSPRTARSSSTSSSSRRILDRIAEIDEARPAPADHRRRYAINFTPASLLEPELLGRGLRRVRRSARPRPVARSPSSAPSRWTSRTRPVSPSTSRRCASSASASRSTTPAPATRASPSSPRCGRRSSRSTGRSSGASATSAATPSRRSSRPSCRSAGGSARSSSPRASRHAASSSCCARSASRTARAICSASRRPSPSAPRPLASLLAGRRARRLDEAPKKRRVQPRVGEGRRRRLTAGPAGEGATCVRRHALRTAARVPSRHARTRHRVAGHGVTRRGPRVPPGAPSLRTVLRRSTPTARPARSSPGTGSIGDTIVVNSKRRPALADEPDPRPADLAGRSSDGHDWVSVDGTVEVVEDQATAQADIAAMARRVRDAGRGGRVDRGRSSASSGSASG